LEDTVYWYKAEIHPDFKIGAPELWKFSQQNLRNGEDDGVNQYDPNSAKKLKGPAIQIRKY
jgi:hypothetical protein